MDPKDTTTQPAPQPLPDAPISSVSPASGNPVPDAQSPAADAPIGDIPVPQEVGYTETKSNKLMTLLIVLLVGILMTLVGLFFYKQYMNTVASQSSVTPTPAVEVPEESPTPAPASEEEAELMNIDIPDLDEEMADIDTALEKLQ